MFKCYGINPEPTEIVTSLLEKMTTANPLFQDDLDHGTPQEQAQTTPTKEIAQPRRGGYDCEFVERPAGGVVQADRTSAACPICSLVLREPHQATCCGSIFCHSCIQDVRNVCPACKGEFSAFADESFKRSLYAITIRCSQRGAGCEWVGKLGELDEHLNLQPLPKKLLVGCQFFEVECSYCMQPFQRRYVQAHQSDSCHRRPYTCQHCNKYAASFEDVTQNHWPVCPFFPLSCPNNCEEVIQRQELEHHVSQGCPLTLVECNFRKVGCSAKLARKDVQSHLRDNVIEHMRLQQMVLVQLQNIVTQCLDENDQLREALNTRERKVQTTLAKHQQKLEEVTFTGTLPFNFVMNDFEQHKRASDCWYSPSFYTHTHGYRMCIKICSNGCRSGSKTHVTVYGCLMRGDFDDDLRWPFQGAITIQLLNQLEDRNHHTYTINFARTADPARVSRIMTGERAENGVGVLTFIAHTQLGLSAHQNCQYLANNQLKFAVLKAINLDSVTLATRRCQTLETFASMIESRVCVVPIEFTLSGFEDYKKQKSVWYSPAFFTRPRGYRMCVKVYPNGWGEGEGTHVSIFICMMQGPFDAGLKWPFRGDVTFQIANQTESGDHFRMMIPLNHQTFGRSINRVLDRKRSAGLGCPQVLSHSSLAPKYLQGDAIRIQISRVKSF